jgi:hypothetical protein
VFVKRFFSLVRGFPGCDEINSFSLQRKTQHEGDMSLSIRAAPSLPDMDVLRVL